MILRTIPVLAFVTIGLAAQVPQQPSLPEPTSSFGAVALDGWLYVYGGHVVPTHSYSTESGSGRFHRLRLGGGTAWEALPGGPKLQGMNLAAHGQYVYRVGGMEARNTPGAKPDLHSVAEVARFDPPSQNWDRLPPLPEGRSSHDVVAVGNRLYVVGGWNMQGGSRSEWAETVATIDLAQAAPAWSTIAQPFKRRALVAATLDARVYVIGGIDHTDKVQLTVNVLDTTTATWSEGPPLPKGAINGFSPAAAVHAGRLYVSVGDGGLHRLSSDGASWEPVSKGTPRIVHRMVVDGDRLLILGGASKGTNLDLVEAVVVGASGDRR